MSKELAAKLTAAASKLRNAASRVEAKIFDTTKYNWYTYQGDSQVDVNFRGKPISIQRGDRYGTRRATSAKGMIRLITEKLGPNYVMTIDPTTAFNLEENSSRIDMAYEANSGQEVTIDGKDD